MRRASVRPAVSASVRPAVWTSDGDENVSAYVEAITTAGATVSPAQRSAMNSFVGTEKAAGRWTSLARLYLPIWGVAAANAIEFKTLASVTFTGGITHSAGYITPDGTTGHVDSNETFGDTGGTQSAIGWGWLSPGGGTAATNNMGVGDAGGGSYYVGQHFDIQGVRMFVGELSTFLPAGAETFEQAHGIVSMQRTGGAHFIGRRDSGGYVELASLTLADSIAPPALNYFLGSYNNSGNPNLDSNINYGAFFVTLGFTSAADNAFTGNLKTLWETLTGQTIP